MKRIALAALALCACSDLTLCPAVQYIDGFELVLMSDAWNQAQYEIEVTYRDSYGDFGFRCPLSVPAPIGDAGVDARGNFRCTPVMPTARAAYGQAGQELVLRFEGTPDSAHLIVRSEGATVLERDIALSYEQQRPYGLECRGSFFAAASVDLPQ